MAMACIAFFAGRPATHGRANVQQKNVALLLLWSCRWTAWICHSGLSRGSCRDLSRRLSRSLSVRDGPAVPRMGRARCMSRILPRKVNATC